jgi:hypothetical protein
MTRWGGCCLSTGGAMSACPNPLTGHPTACHFGSGAYSYFRLSVIHDMRVLTLSEVPSVALFEADFPFRFPHGVGENGKRKWERRQGLTG